MCGLFGVAASGALDRHELQRADHARDTLSLRGPDAASHWNNDHVYLGHRRLSIIDTSDLGIQPMVAGGVVLTVNGEIYNFRELRAELVAAGYQFASHSDSEVLLHGYRHWGVNALVEKIDGMYAAVLYDEPAGRIVAFRDRVGIKPFYYGFDGLRLVWGSELKAIVAFLGRENLVTDNTAIIDFLACRHIPAPKTLYQKIFKLEPASILTFDIRSAELGIRRYWNLPKGTLDDSAESLAEQTVQLLRESVHEQLVSDVPLGLLLSGGVDSSAIAAFATERGGLKSFSVAFPEDARDETHAALLVAARIGSQHKVHQFDYNQMEKLTELLVRWFDEPFSNHSAVPSFQICNFARQDVTVALCGDGGDELFGGYRWYERFAKVRKIQSVGFPRWGRGFPLPAFVPRRKAIDLLTTADPAALYAKLRGSLSEVGLSRWKAFLGVPPDYDCYWAYRRWFDPSLPSRKAAQVMDFHTYLPDEMLTKVDRVSMTASLECRPPFLSKKLIEFAFTLPETFLYRGNRLKGGLKFALSTILPREILTREKQGFSVKSRHWKKTLALGHESAHEAILKSFVEQLNV